jgi:hypothetical protein
MLDLIHAAATPSRAPRSRHSLESDRLAVGLSDQLHHMPGARRAHRQRTAGATENDGSPGRAYGAG